MAMKASINAISVKPY